MDTLTRAMEMVVCAVFLLAAVPLVLWGIAHKSYPMAGLGAAVLGVAGEELESAARRPVDGPL